LRRIDVLGTYACIEKTCEGIYEHAGAPFEVRLMR
jgi:hypothetical protein